MNENRQMKKRQQAQRRFDRKFGRCLAFLTAGCSMAAALKQSGLRTHELLRYSAGSNSHAAAIWLAKASGARFNQLIGPKGPPAPPTAMTMAMLAVGGANSIAAVARLLPKTSREDLCSFQEKAKAMFSLVQDPVAFAKYIVAEAAESASAAASTQAGRSHGSGTLTEEFGPGDGSAEVE